MKPLQAHKELTASQDRSSGVNQGYSILFFTTEQDRFLAKPVHPVRVGNERVGNEIATHPLDGGTVGIGNVLASSRLLGP